MKKISKHSSSTESYTNVVAVVGGGVNPMRGEREEMSGRMRNEEFRI